jgi:hypothetical protein
MPPLSQREEPKPEPPRKARLAVAVPKTDPDGRCQGCAPGLRSSLAPDLSYPAESQVDVIPLPVPLAGVCFAHAASSIGRQPAHHLNLPELTRRGSMRFAVLGATPRLLQVLASRHPLARPRRCGSPAGVATRLQAATNRQRSGCGGPMPPTYECPVSLNR